MTTVHWSAIILSCTFYLTSAWVIEGPKSINKYCLSGSEQSYLKVVCHRRHRSISSDLSTVNTALSMSSESSAADLSYFAEKTTTEAPSDDKIEKSETEDSGEWEYEEVEYENLTEADFVNSEWLVGTNLNSDPNKIMETWCRLVTSEDGKNVAIWGDKSEGKWEVEVSTQYFSISKETFGGWGGKKIWAGTIDDYYYLQGTVRGYTFFSPASVLGQWQAKRLGIDPETEDPGVAPWFQKNDDDGDNEETKDKKEESSNSEASSE